MTKPVAVQHNLKLLLGMLLGIAIGNSTLIGVLASWSLPNWLGAAIGVAALVGALVVLWRQEATRARYVILFVAAMAAAPLLAWLLSEHT